MRNYGLRIREPKTGRIKIDTSSRIGRILGMVTLPDVGGGERRSGSIPLDGPSKYGEVFIFVDSDVVIYGRVIFNVWYNNDAIHYDISCGDQAALGGTNVFYGVR
ncbi:hypothetical protein SAMN05421784_10726 [Xenorhabdus koppenhoeferi]|uniref:Uncharacterized protein n=2 Tax=Xenorhabdus koppenhoeferi TaxID=351659 RepID=A0A1I7G6P3_9GAMM|nr:hypothetical protein SAMN05421784_10726 [Xenorhabdus koppenhoeferi]